MLVGHLTSNIWSISCTQALGELLGPGSFKGLAPDCVGAQAEAFVQGLQDGQVLPSCPACALSACMLHTRGWFAHAPLFFKVLTRLAGAH